MKPDRIYAGRYRLVQGAYHSTVNDCANRWYIDDIESDFIDRRGSGFPSKKAAASYLMNAIRCGELPKAGE